MTRRIFIAVFFSFLLASAALADGITDVVIDGNQVTAQIQLPLGIQADLTLTFEQVTGLTEENLGLSAELISLLDLQGLLPSGTLKLPLSFPVLIHIDPPPTSNLAFSGPMEMEIYTHNLSYVGCSKLRMFSGPLGGPLQDMSASASSGSYRIGTFQPETTRAQSNVVLLDLRPVNSVIDLKLDGLQDALDDHATLIDPVVLADLQYQLNAIASSIQAGATVPSINEVEDFIDTVEAHAGSEIPNLWQDNTNLVNVAGDLISRAATLRFSLLEKSNCSGGLLGGLL